MVTVEQSRNKFGQRTGTLNRRSAMGGFAKGIPRNARKERPEDEDIDEPRILPRGVSTNVSDWPYTEVSIRETLTKMMNTNMVVILLLE